MLLGGGWRCAAARGRARGPRERNYRIMLCERSTPSSYIHPRNRFWRSGRVAQSRDVAHQDRLYHDCAMVRRPSVTSKSHVARDGRRVRSNADVHIVRRDLRWRQLSG